MNRRYFLSTLALASGCSVRRTAIRPPAASYNGRRLAPVNVSSERVIRTVAGLRPYRASGFVVRTESIGGKTIVHNYGHGGGGITLSWGTAHLAVEQALPTNARRMAVIGAGAVGLATGRLLQEHGVEVTIYAKDLPPATTSNIAGGQVFPVNVYDRDSATPAFLNQFMDAARFSYRRYQLMIGEYYGIRWMPNYILDNAPLPERGLHSKQSPILDVMPELRDLSRDEHPFPVPYVRQFDTMFVQPSVYLEAMLREFRIAGGTVQVREMHNLREALDLPHPVIINCTGLGAKALFNDAELTPVKGQLTFLLPQPEVEYATLGPGDLYMFPRRDGVLLGGTHEHGNWDLEPDREAEARIIAAHAEIFHGMRG